jgi:hypothetical protein
MFSYPTAIQLRLAHPPRVGPGKASRITYKAIGLSSFASSTPYARVGHDASLVN